MNKLEKGIYNLVKSTPRLKFILRNLYQGFFDLMPRKGEYFLDNIQYKQGFFFGFHDINPFSKTNDKLLSNRLLNDNLIIPNLGDKLNVGFFNLENGLIKEYVELDSSLSWNFHKGCRLQWLDDKTIIFNTYFKKKLVSKTLNIQSKEKTYLDFPIDSLSADSTMASSFSYERLNHFMPGYGYKGVKDKGFLSEKTPEHTGIFIYDISSGKLLKMISLKALVDLDESKQKLFPFNHFVTHSSFSKDGHYLSFLHRWVGTDLNKRKSKLIVYDIKNDKYIIIPAHGMVSHYVWTEENNIIAYCNIDGVDGHYMISIPNIDIIMHIGPESLNSDGHQTSVSNNSFITDTYPDKYRLSTIIRIDISENKSETIGRIYSPKKFQTKSFKNHIACDLHPRSSKDGTLLCFDAVRKMKRSICVMRI